MFIISKIRKFFFFLLIFLMSSYQWVSICSQKDSRKPEAAKEKKARILLFEPWNFVQPGGLGISNYYQEKLFAQNKKHFMMLFWQGSYSETLLKQDKLPYEVLSKDLYKKTKLTYAEFLKKLENSSWIPLPATVYIEEFSRICKKNNINTIITPAWTCLPLLKIIAKKLNIKLLLLRHASLNQELSWELNRNLSFLRGIDGFIGGNPEITEYIKKANTTHKLGIKHFTTITPFWNEYKCLQFSTKESKSDYFRKKFNINIDNSLLLCTVANLVDPCKNIQLLLRAVHYLITQKNKVMHVMIAGNGPLRNELEQLVSELQINSFVHFLGIVNNVPELLFHCDAHVLPSYFESFSIANLEAACMKKPIIIAKEVPASQIIKNLESGLTFHSNDVIDLALKIEYLYDHPQETIRMGLNAFNTVKKKYSNNSVYEQWQKFLKKVIV